MADVFTNELCGPKPVPSDFLKKNGNVKWKAYNKANTRWLKCAKTSARQDPANVAARAESASQIGVAVAGAAGQIGTALAGGEVVDLGATPKPVESSSDFASYLPWVAAAAVGYLLLGR